MNIRKILEKISKAPFIRDNGWVFMPLFYLSLILIVVGFYNTINHSIHYSFYNNGSIDGVPINEASGADSSLYKVTNLHRKPR